MNKRFIYFLDVIPEILAEKAFGTKFKASYLGKKYNYYL